MFNKIIIMYIYMVRGLMGSAGIIVKDNPIAYRQQYYERNKERIRKYQKKYYEKNKEKIKKYQREWYKNSSEYQKKYYAENKDKILKYHKEWYKNKKSQDII